MTKMQPWKIFMPENIHEGFQNLHFDTLTLNQLELTKLKGGQR
jgi:hypothetical protein